MVLIAIENYLAGADATLSSSSEDDLYVLENLYNGRPSKPFRFTGIGAIGVPEWVCIEFDSPKAVTLAAIFNHNLTAVTGANDELELKADDGTCAGAPWGAPDYDHDLQPHLVADWNDLYHTFSETRLSYRFEFIDLTNTDGYIELGELFLGSYTALSTAHLKPGRVEDPMHYRWWNVTPYGQHWAQSLSRSVKLNLTVTNLSDPAVMDSVRVLIQDIHEANDRFVIIPNDMFPFVYYVVLDSDSGFMSQVVRGFDCEVTDWTFDLAVLTKGIILL